MLVLFHLWELVGLATQHAHAKNGVGAGESRSKRTRGSVIAHRSAYSPMFIGGTVHQEKEKGML
jgi:hypothetical protein